MGLLYKSFAGTFMFTGSLITCGGVGVVRAPLGESRCPFEGLKAKLGQGWLKRFLAVFDHFSFDQPPRPISPVLYTESQF